MTGRYGLAIMKAMRIAGAGTVLALGGFIFFMVRRERLAPATRAPGTGAPNTHHSTRGTR